MPKAKRETAELTIEKLRRHIAYLAGAAYACKESPDVMARAFGLCDDLHVLVQDAEEKRGDEDTNNSDD